MIPLGDANLEQLNYKLLDYTMNEDVLYIIKESYLIL